MSPDTAPIAVVGGGPVGLASAVALARLGLPVTLIAPPHRPAAGGSDNRTAALFAGSIELLRNLGVWPALAPVSEPIRGIRLVDDTRALFRGPEIVFTATEVSRQEFGWNVPNAAIVAELHAAAKSAPHLETIENATVTRLEFGATEVRLTLSDGRAVAAALAVGADGRNSICREAAGIATRAWTYDQSAIACTFAHERPHAGISTEFHRPKGPLTTVPMQGQSSSLVWVEARPEAERLAALDADTFSDELETRLMGLLGAIHHVSRRVLFPLAGLSASELASDRVALVGEAAHVMPPIGAQGLNLGLRDAAALADCAADTLALGGAPGDASFAVAYKSARRLDVATRVTAIDVLNRSLLTELLPLQLLRGAGLHAVAAIGPLRRMLVREGLEPALSRPTLMQPGGDVLLADRARPGGARPAA